MTDEQIAWLSDVRDRLRLILIDLDAILEDIAKYRAQVSDYHANVQRIREERSRELDGFSRRVQTDLDEQWRGIKFGRNNQPVSVRRFDEDGA